MVWFQCEDCGENLKKPKLLNHFRRCSAYKLSCIDCGETFGQESVQGHNQCITEAEKYGPKGQAKATNGSTPKSNKGSQQKPDVDINVGLSTRPPWFCSLCNTKATSQQTLLLHADGKKHRAKARAIAKQQQAEESALDTKVSTENVSEAKLTDAVGEPKHQDVPEPVPSNAISNPENGNLSLNKKRKLDDTDEGVNGEVIQVEEKKGEKTVSQSKKAKHEIKWKKLITTALKANEGSLKLKKLRKYVLKSLQESGITGDKAQLCVELEDKINSSSRFTVDGKYVKLSED